MIHRYHPDPKRDDNPAAVLWDDCPRCDDHADHPASSLDEEHLRRLWRRYSARVKGLTGNESRAGSDLWNAVLIARRLGEVFGSEPVASIVGHEPVGSDST